MRLRTLLFLLCALTGTGLLAQEPVAAIPGDQPIIALYGRVAGWATRLEPMLTQIRTDDWIAKGASPTYGQQAASVMVQLKAVQQEMTTMQSRPDTLQDGMKALFRIQAFNRSLNSVLAGLRKYQNPALADLVVAVAAESSTDFQALEAHLLEVADQRETAYQVVEHEAQRCRGDLSRQPAPPRTPVRKPGQ